MDSLTQFVLGAATGEAVLGKKIGNKAVLWGGLLATLPDLDVIPTMWMDTVDRLSFHRGFSHSIVFFVLGAPLFGWLFQRFFQRYGTTWRDWTLFSFLVLFTHALLDAFTSWGTQLFWPHPYRVAWNTIFVVDPLYTIPFLAAVVWTMFYPRSSATRKRINYAGIAFSSAYLLFTVVNKQLIDNTFEQALRSEKIEFSRFSSKPTPFNNILWFAVAESDSGYHIGYYSILDKNKEISFTHFKKNHELLDTLPKTDDLNTLLHISNGYYVLERANEGVLLHDLRFGQTMNPKTGKGEFVFSFLLKRNGTGTGERVEINQTPRNFSDITGDMFAMLWRRMMGDKEIRM